MTSQAPAEMKENTKLRDRDAKEGQECEHFQYTLRGILDFPSSSCHVYMATATRTAIEDVK